MVLVYGISVISQGMQHLMPSPFFWLSVGSVAFYLAGTYLALRTFQTNELVRLEGAQREVGAR